MAEKENINNESGFTIIDKRIGAKKADQTKESTKPNAGAPAREETVKDKVDHAKKAKEGPFIEKDKKGENQENRLPEVDFASLIISLSTSVYIHLGELSDPTTNEKDVNLPLAKQTIDILTMLKEKTKGNRTPEEDKLMEEMLYNLRMSFVAVSNKNT